MIHLCIVRNFLPIINVGLVSIMILNTKFSNVSDIPIPTCLITHFFYPNAFMSITILHRKVMHFELPLYYKYTYNIYTQVSVIFFSSRWMRSTGTKKNEFSRRRLSRNTLQLLMNWFGIKNNFWNKYPENPLFQLKFIMLPFLNT